MASHAEAPGRVLVGRDLELAAVREVLNRTAEGQSETLLVFGEAGVGKTALVQHGAAGARPLDVAAQWSMPPAGVDQRAVASAQSCIP